MVLIAHPFSLQLTDHLHTWYRCFLFLALNCNVAVVHACQYFQIAEIYKTKSLQNFVRLYLENRLSGQWQCTRTHLGSEWTHSNGTEIRWTLMGDYISVYCCYARGPLFRGIRIGKSMSKRKSFKGIVIVDELHQSVSEICLLIGSCPQQIGMAIEELILLCELRLPKVFPTRAIANKIYKGVTPTIATVDYFIQTEECGHCASQPPELFRCSRCKMERYCNSKCQQNDWSWHKLKCKK